jgi:hypothetical protein
MSHSRLKDFERTLLDSGAREAPSAARRSAARAAVLRSAGIGAAAAAAALASSTAAVAPTAQVASAVSSLSGTVAGTAKLSLIAKVVLLSALAAGLLAGAVVITRRGGSANETATITAPRPLPTSAPVEPLGTAIDVAALPEATVSAPAPPMKPASAPAHAEPVDPVAAEARLLDAARRCLAAGDLACARARLADYDARFRGGVLQEEARVLEGRIQRAGEAR